jgi:hypothetical protein
MYVFLMRFRTTWNDYFTGTYSNNPNSQTFTSRKTPSGTSVYVSNCLFKSITSTDSGGALCCTSATYLLVESTSFFTCTTSGEHGGAIFFQNTKNGQCVLYGVCGNGCCATYTSSTVYGQFSRIDVNDGNTSKSYVNYSSITRCVNTNSNSYYMLALFYGKICCPSVNMSMNKCQYRPGISCWPYKDSNSITCSLTYSSFTNNNANGHGCNFLNAGGSNYEIKSCNILRNTQGTLNSQGTIYTSGNLNIEDSCILENTATNTFYQASSYYTITISRCTVDKMTCNQNLVIQSTATKSFIIALNHISTHNCHSEYDSVGTLTPIIQLSPSSSKKKILCFTYGKFLHLPRICDLLSFASVFIFNFIHP